jgi:CheY-like chemotaxis protein
LINLIGNALKFHIDERSVEVSLCVQLEQENVRFDITDNGIGIPQDHQDHLFQQFVQLNDNTTRLYGGTGLGLSICKNIVECMGGSIWLDSSHPGIGSKFSFQIPFTPYVDEPSNVIMIHDIPRRRSVSGEDLTDCKILVAEDNAINRKVIKKMLETIGIDGITLVENGKIAVQEFMQQHFDLVILDLGMPIMGGVQAAMEMREYENKMGVHFRIPIMACTADVTSSLHEECLKVGMDDVVTKPIAKYALKEAMLRLLRKI